MTRQILRGAAGVLFLVCLLGPLRLAAGASASIDVHPTVPESMGINIHFTDPRPGEMEALAATGVGWIRTDLSWESSETAPGRYDFSAHDRLLAALAPYHIRAILVLCYTNPLYDGGLPPHTDEGRAAFAHWAAAAAAHFSGHGVVWELWNEPNYIRFWPPKPNVDDYSKLALTVGEQFLESAPGETLIGPATAVIDVPFLNACFRAGLLNYWSAVSVHPYRQLDPETATGVFQALAKLIAVYLPPAKQVPLVASEWGYSTGWSAMKGMDDNMQARMAAREFLNNLASGVPLTIWYEWTDHGNSGSDPEGRFGLIQDPAQTQPKPLYIPKPAYEALQTLATFFQGYRFARRIDIGAADDYALVFSNGTDERLAAWTRAADSGGKHKATIPDLKGQFLLCGYLGGKAKKVKAHRDGLALQLTGDPVYLRRR